MKKLLIASVFVASFAVSAEEATMSSGLLGLCMRLEHNIQEAQLKVGKLEKNLILLLESYERRNQAVDRIKRRQDPNYEGSPLQLEIYADEDRVKLLKISHSGIFLLDRIGNLRKQYETRCKGKVVNPVHLKQWCEKYPDLFRCNLKL